MATLFDLNLSRGSQFSIRLIAHNEDGSAINLSGYELRGQAKQGYSGPLLVDLNPTKVAGFETSGYIDILLSSAQTSGIPVTQGVYDIEIYQTGSSYAEALIKGYIEVHPDVTF